MPHRFTHVAVASLVAGLLAPSAVAGSTAPQPRGEGLAVTGFALGNLSHRALRRDAPALTTLTVAGVSLKPDGRGVGAPTPSMVRLGRVGRAEGLRTELLLSNYSNEDEGFDELRAHLLLSDADAVDAVADRMVALVEAGGWDGVNVDLELVRRADAAGLVSLVETLQERLPASATVTIDISASTSVRGYRARGYDLERLGAVVDRIELMAYDQHGPTWSGPGPIGALDWQRDSVAAMLKKVPADTIDLGVAGYGYTWPRVGTGRSVKPGGARAMARKAGVPPVWHGDSGEWSARLPNGTVVWWSDARSYRQRLKLARGLGVHGLALWRLGSADPLR